MRKIFTLISIMAFAGMANAQSNFDGFFISEYFEGSGNDKGVEIYNGGRGNATINLNRIRLRIYANGGGTPSGTITLATAADGSTTTLAVNTTFVIYNAGTSWTAGNVGTNMPNCPSSRRFASGSLTHNGDDALELQIDTTGAGDWKTVDIFGKIGEDPGTAWTSGAISTLDKSLEKKSSVNIGVITNPTTFDPAANYDDNGSITMPNTTLGAHTTNSPLPISLVKFTADKFAEKVKVQWTTATELNNDKFVVERSADGENFEFVSELRGAGNSRELNAYEVVDAKPLKGTSYYRLTQYDFNGASETFAPVAVNMGKGAMSLEQVAGSMEQGAGSMGLRVFSPSNASATLAIRDLSGRTLYSEEVLLQEGYQQFNINTTTIGAGIYLIQLNAGTEVVIKKAML